MKVKINCKYCKKMIIRDWKKFLEEDKENYIQCPYCLKIWKYR